MSIPASANGWINFRLGDVCTKIGSGATPRGGDSVYVEQSDYTIIRSQNVHNEGFRRNGLAYITKEHADELANVEIKESDVLLNITGDSVARCCQVDPRVLPARVNQHVSIIRPDASRLDPRYLRFWLVSSGAQRMLLSWASAGGTRNALTKRMIESLEVPAPSDVNLQRVIGSILGTLDDKIELNRRVSDTLETLACAIFKSWFVDFDPVRAKAGGRQPLGTSPEIAAYFPAELIDSQIGRLPRGWQVGPITSRARLLSGGTPKTNRADYWDGEVLWCSAKDVSQSRDTALVVTERTITHKGLHESATQLIPERSTVVVARGATTGRLVLLGREMAMNQTCYALQSTAATPLALYCQLRSEIGNLVHAAHGSVFDTITTTTFANSLVVLPPEPLLLAFENAARPLFDLILSNVNECRILAQLRDTLLPKLLSGEIRLKDAEKTVGAVV